MNAIEARHYLLSITLDKKEIPSNDEHPFTLPLVKNLNNLVFHPNVTFIVGENGSGKSTLLEAIAVGMGFNPEGGSKNIAFATRESHSTLHKYMTLSKGVRRMKDGYFLRAESFYNLASAIESYGVNPGMSKTNRSLHEQSHGESFLTLIEHRFNGQGLYILDEPEAALSPSAQLKLLRLLHDHNKRGAQFIIATHSPILMGYPEAQIYVAGEYGLDKIAYEDTEHYQLTKYFLGNRQKVLRELLNE